MTIDHIVGFVIGAFVQMLLTEFFKARENRLRRQIDIAKRCR
jgi:hypothetical protein